MARRSDIKAIQKFIRLIRDIQDERAADGSVPNFGYEINSIEGHLLNVIHEIKNEFP